jgi:hypothetical protein
MTKVSDYYKNVTHEAKKSRQKPVEMAEAAKRLQAPIPLQYDRDLHDAMTMAEHFDSNKHEDGYVIKEGWDLHDLIHSLVVLWRVLRGEISRGHVEIVSAQKKSSDSP